MNQWCAAVWLLTAIEVFSAAVVIPVPIATARQGFASVALVDSNGVLARTLAYAEPVASTGRTFFWDGTTDLGLAAPAGSYSVRALFFTNGPAATYVMKVGTSGNPPWRLRNGTGDWGGDLGGPSAIIANNSSLMVTWSAVENNTLTGIQQVDTNGSVLRSYISFAQWDGRLAGAMDDTNMFLGILNRSAQRIDLAKYQLGTTNKWILTNLPTVPHFSQSGRWKNRWQAMLDGMALSSDRIFATMALDDRLFVLDRVTGATLHQVSLPSPRGVAISGGRLLVVTSNEIVSLTFDGVVQSTLISGAPLDDPYAIAVDRSGNIYVSDGGSQRTDPEADTGSHQVHVFGADGQHLRSFGPAGGSPRSGQIIRQAFGDIRGICIGPDNKLWVNEEITGFKRTSRWNTNGVLEQEWFQRKLTHFADLINPARPHEVVYPQDGFDDRSGLTAYTINVTNGTWEPTWSFEQKQDDQYQEDVFLANTHSNPLQQYQPGRRYPAFHYNPRELVTFQGRNYFLNHEGNGDGTIFTYSDTEKPRPVGMIGYHRVDLITNRIVSYYDTGPNRWFTWVDRDGNGRMAITECTFTTGSQPLGLSVRIFTARLETNLSVRMIRPISSTMFVESILPLKEVLPNGAPVYDWALLQDLAPIQMPTFEGGDLVHEVRRVSHAYVPVESEGAIYSLVDPRPEIPVNNLPSLDNFWANRNWRKRITKFDRAGKFLWAAGRRAPSRAIQGEMYNPFGISVSHGAVFAADVLGMVWVWSTDGLYLGRLLQDAEPGRTWDEYAIHAEIQGTVTLTTNSGTGKLYMLLNDTGAHLYEVELPQVTALPPTTITLSAANANAARAWDPDKRPPPAGSVLSIRAETNRVILSWHTNAGGMRIQSASKATSTWSALSVGKVTNAAAVEVTLPNSSTGSFYRLTE